MSPATTSTSSGGSTVLCAETANPGPAPVVSTAAVSPAGEAEGAGVRAFARGPFARDPPFTREPFVPEPSIRKPGAPFLASFARKPALSLPKGGVLDFDAAVFPGAVVAGPAGPGDAPA